MVIIHSNSQYDAEHETQSECESFEDENETPYHFYLFHKDHLLLWLQRNKY